MKNVNNINAASCQGIWADLDNKVTHAENDEEAHFANFLQK